MPGAQACSFDFETDSWQELWTALRGVVEFWIEQGVRVFRVDNPHTKPFPFWEWLIGEVKAAHPETVFLSEAFTRPKVMYRLAKLGFTQSYTYFAWRTTAWELREYLSELTDPNGRVVHANWAAALRRLQRAERSHGTQPS